jgi:general secretion pathway protein L
MSVLVIQLPARERLGARASSAEGLPNLRLPSTWHFTLSNDGRSVAQSGTVAPALLPKADHVVLAVAEGDLSWHRVEIPKAPAARLRAALLGVMEEALLEDDEALHFALAPGAQPGQTGWVAVTHRAWLANALASLEATGLSVERVVCANLPGELPRAHFFVANPDANEVPSVALSRADGATTLRLSGGLARALQPSDMASARATTTPAAAAAAERWLGAPVALMTDAERGLEAAQSSVNLRQFDLAARHRGTRALREIGKRFLSSDWRPVRAGLAAMLALHLVGLNAYAWQQRQALSAKRQAMTDLLKSAHPGVRAVLDAPLQMQRETERLRAAAGRPGDNDLEALMGAAASGWPDGMGPAQTLRFDAGRLTLTAAGFADPQMVQFRDRLRGLGFAVELNEGRMVVSRSAVEVTAQTARPAPVVPSTPAPASPAAPPPPANRPPAGTT